MTKFGLLASRRAGHKVEFSIARVKCFVGENGAGKSRDIERYRDAGTSMKRPQPTASNIAVVVRDVSNSPSCVLAT